MNIEEIRKVMPEGATHYNNGGKYFKVDSVGYLYFWMDDKWKPMYMTIKQSQRNLKPL